MSSRRSRFSDAPTKQFKPSPTDSHDDVLAKIDEKLNNVDALLAGFDNPKNPLNFIPSSVNKSSSNSNSKSIQNTATPPNSEVTKTITITATSFKVEHHNDDAATPPMDSVPTINAPEPPKLRPLPSPNAKPAKSVLLKSKSTTFREEKRKRRSKKESDAKSTKSSKSKHKRNVTFGASVKSEDGVSAKFYSSQQYLISDGNYLRPKPRQQIENEKRLLQMLGAPEELAGRALPPGLLDEDWEEEYDPQLPNDYTAFVTARLRLQEWIQMRKVKK